MDQKLLETKNEEKLKGECPNTSEAEAAMKSLRALNFNQEQRKKENPNVVDCGWSAQRMLEHSKCSHLSQRENDLIKQTKNLAFKNYIRRSSSLLNGAA